MRVHPTSGKHRAHSCWTHSSSELGRAAVVSVLHMRPWRREEGEGGTGGGHGGGGALSHQALPCSFPNSPQMTST